MYPKDFYLMFALFPIAEEAALMDMLHFIYTGRLQATSALGLLDVLMVADKYEVASCMRHCSKLLRNLPMTPDSALLYLEFPSSVLLAEAMQPLTDAAINFLVSQLKDITRLYLIFIFELFVWFCYSDVLPVILLHADIKRKS